MWFGAAIAIVAGCGLQLPDPEPRSVAPAWGYNGEDTWVVVEGSHFYPQVEVDASHKDAGDVDRTYVVRLVGPLDGSDDTKQIHELSGVSLRDFGTLDAIVPAGLKTGMYDLEVENPTGGLGRLVSSFTVTDSRADRLVIDTESVVYEVHSSARLDVELVDGNGRRVFSPIDVVIDVTGDRGPVSGSFAPGALEDQQDLEDGLGIAGRITAGLARVDLVVETPQTVTVRVSPSDRSPVADGTIKLEWEPGSDLSVRIDLPDSPAPFSTTVGESFEVGLTLLDQFGNEAEGQVETLLLKNACESWATAVDVPTSATVAVSLRTATGTTECPQDRIVVVAGLSGGALPESAPFTVRPGPVDHFDVEASPTSVTAGDKSLSVFATPVDLFGNRAIWPVSLVEVEDSVGGVLSSECFAASSIFCKVASKVAASDVRLTVRDATGVSGTSNAYAVAPGPPAALSVHVAPSVGTAGEPMEVALSVTDAWGNPLSADTFGDEGFLFASDAESPVCVRAPALDARVWYACTFERAVEDTALRVAVDGTSVQGASDPFDVANGPLVAVTVVPSTGTVVAGQSLDVLLQGFDAFGNPYRKHADPVVDIADLGGTFSVPSATFGPDGSASLTGSFTKAGLTEVTVRQAGADLGRSTPIEVVAAAAQSVVIKAPPWAWVDDPTGVSVSAVDAYGNRATYGGTASLGSESGQLVGLQVVLVDGAGGAQVTWSAPFLAERLSATTADGLSGQSGAIAVVDDCGSAGPAPELRFGGFADAVTCFDPTAGRATLTGSMAGSKAGGAPLSLWGLAVTGGASATSTSGPTVSVDVKSVGVYEVRGLVAASDGCAAEIATTAYVGPDDGSPTGFIDLDVTASKISIGTGATVVKVDGVTDCTRDPAAGGKVFVRTDRGKLVGATATGTGLQLVLDGAGDASFTLSASGVATGGDAGIRAGVASGAARGSAVVNLDGDSRKPVVWDQDPRGTASGSVSEVTLRFSEALLPSSVTPTRFTVTGPQATAVTKAALSSSGTEVTLTLSPPVSADAGRYGVRVDPNVRDKSGGQKLDGTWSGLATAFEGAFGAVDDASPDVGDCAAAVALFRPDGDPGAAQEADALEISFAAGDEPTWWRVSVYDASDALQRREHLVPLGATDAWTWDGRDVGERIVPNGRYTVSVDALDTDGNVGSACAVAVTVDNRWGE